jgi:branched-chain amino acid transport system permease protein
MFMPDGVLPALAGLRARFLSPAEGSIREVTAAELRESADA